MNFRYFSSIFSTWRHAFLLIVTGTVIFFRFPVLAADDVSSRPLAEMEYRYLWSPEQSADWIQNLNKRVTELEKRVAELESMIKDISDNKTQDPAGNDYER